MQPSKRWGAVSPRRGGGLCPQDPEWPRPPFFWETARMRVRRVSKAPGHGADTGGGPVVRTICGLFPAGHVPFACVTPARPVPRPVGTCNRGSRGHGSLRDTAGRGVGGRREAGLAGGQAPSDPVSSGRPRAADTLWCPVRRRDLGALLTSSCSPLRMWSSVLFTVPPLSHLQGPAQEPQVACGRTTELEH